MLPKQINEDLVTSQFKKLDMENTVSSKKNEAWIISIHKVSQSFAVVTVYQTVSIVYQ